jgi:hypothetical protein
MIFDTKIAFIVRNDLPVWQRLNVVAFLATGIADAAPEIMGKPYIDSQGRTYGSISGQPILIFEGCLEKLQTVHKKALERDVTLIPYIHIMFSTRHDEENRDAFMAADAENLDLVGIGLYGPKKTVDKLVKGLSLHS